MKNRAMMDWSFFGLDGDAVSDNILLDLDPEFAKELGITYKRCVRCGKKAVEGSIGPRCEECNT